MAAGTSNYWEDLRKQARQLENELDLKLVSFSKLCTSYSHSSARDGRRDRYSSDTTPLLNGSSQDRMFETMAIEIEQLLARLTGVNDKMAEYTSSAGVPSLNAALMHTLQRHRDILQDYTHEFHKTKANFVAIRERENLMGSVRKDIESYKSGSGVNNRRTELFLKEHDHLRNSDRLIEETIRFQKSSSGTKNFHIPFTLDSQNVIILPHLLFRFFFSELLVNKFTHDASLPLNISVSVFIS
ncbi:Golgi SNAP receptor complex member 1 isoform X3 [Bos indicus]|uniref:Golgi SNAP receptor complex member 1 n=1 Tax=Bos indicus TaxID=9915 RepID=A0ABM4R023_BOSIN